MDVWVRKGFSQPQSVSINMGRLDMEDVEEVEEAAQGACCECL